MNDWKKEYGELKTTLEKFGWQCIKNDAIDLEEWYSQGVLYTNFSKKDKAIHIEYGNEDCVFGEDLGD
jgi:hypothetical protein